MGDGRAARTRLAGLLCLCAVGSAGASAGPGSAGAKQWPLPEGARIQSGSLRVGGGLRWVYFTRYTSRKEDGKTVFEHSYHVLDTQSGKVHGLLELTGLGGTVEELRWPPEAAPDGKHVAICSAAQDGKMTVYVATLKSSEPRAIARAPNVLSVRWAGRKLAVSSSGPGGKLRPIRLYDPADGETAELAVRGIVAASDKRGSLLACLAHRRDPNRALESDKTRKMSVWLIGAKGKSGRCVAGYVHPHNVVLSPGGKCVAVYEGGSGRRGRVRVVSATGQEKRSLAMLARPVGVFDDARVITLARTLRRGILRLHAGRARPGILARRVADAAVVRGRVFYITRGEPPTLHRKPLPPPANADGKSAQ